MSVLLLLDGGSGGGGGTVPLPDEPDTELIPLVTTLDPTETFDVYPLACVTDHEEQAQFRLLKQFQESPRLKSVVAIFVRQLQQVEDALCELMLLRGVQVAEDIYLDEIGALVGQTRNGLADTEYRKFIQAKIRANRSRGTSADILSVTRLLVDDPAMDITAVEYPFAAFRLDIFGVNGANFSYPDIARLINLTRAAGVHMNVVFADGDVDDAFQFASGSTIEVDGDQGFGDGGGVIGGDFAGVIGPS